MKIDPSNEEVEFISNKSIYDISMDFKSLIHVLYGLRLSLVEDSQSINKFTKISAL